jgi:hypothetical protein
MEHVKYPRFGAESLTLNLLTTTIVSPPSNASKWHMGLNSAFKGLNTLFQLHTSGKIALLMQTKTHPHYRHVKDILTPVLQCSAYEDSSSFQNLLLTPITLCGVCQTAAHRQRTNSHFLSLSWECGNWRAESFFSYFFVAGSVMPDTSWHFILFVKALITNPWLFPED